MGIRGRVWKLGDDINTDLIISGRYKYDILDIKELAKHTFEDLDPELSRKVKPGDIIVAGQNFGCGSSREHAPLVIKALGVRAIVAESFARIFFRNAINVGLAAIECPGVTSIFEEGDVAEISLEKGIIRNLTRRVQLKFRRWPEIIYKIYLAGGLVEYLKQGGKLE